jgi:hypothetical protein
VITLCAYTDLRPETEQATRALWPDTEFVNVAHSTTAYHEALDERWQVGVDLVVIEHDIVPRPDVRAAFDDCDELWCQYSYELAVGWVGLHNGPQSALGCVRFRATLLEAEPDAIDAAGRSDNTGVPENAWWRIDARLNAVLHERGYRPHTHLPAVDHLNPVQKLARV